LPCNKRFIDVFIEKKDISFRKKIGIFSLLLPVIILLPTKFSLISFDLTNCYREPVEGFIATYYPDFFVKKDDKIVYIIETKGREEEDDKLKFKRLQKWCEDVNDRQSRMVYKALYIKQEEWEKDKLKNFDEVVRVFYSV